MDHLENLAALIILGLIALALIIFVPDTSDAKYAAIGTVIGAFATFLTKTMRNNNQKKEVK